ncbi:hypothetical protein V8E54_007195 [Elaphomyces granulatus]
MDNSTFDSVFDSFVHDNNVVDQQLDLSSVDMLSDSFLFSSGLSSSDSSNMESNLEMPSQEPLDFDGFFASFHLEQSSDVSASASDSEALGSPARLDEGLSFTCAFPRCRFKGSDWDIIVCHRKEVHSLSTLGQSQSFCSKCRLVFSRKYTRDRHASTHYANGKCKVVGPDHVMNREKQMFFYCQDCLCQPPIRRKDSYFRHRRVRHGDCRRNSSVCFTTPPQGYLWLPSSTEKSQPHMDIRFVSCQSQNSVVS